MREIAIIVLLVFGALLILISSIGILKMPDFYTRLSQISKANPVGIIAMLLALILSFYDKPNVITRSIIAIIFLLITIPVSGHFLARVAYFIGLEKTKKMYKDELKEKFGSKSHKHEESETSK